MEIVVKIRLIFVVSTIGCAAIITSCERITFFLIYPDKCVVCETRPGNNIWDSLPDWSRQGCGAKAIAIRDSCEILAQKNQTYCSCIWYNR